MNEKLVFDPEWKVITTDYPDLPEFRVKVYSLEEILIEKLRSIIQRGKSKDYYDVEHTRFSPMTVSQGFSFAIVKNSFWISLPKSFNNLLTLSRMTK